MKDYRVISNSYLIGYFNTAEEAEKSAKECKKFALIEKKVEYDGREYWSIVGNNEIGVRKV